MVMMNHRLTILAALLCCSASAPANESPARKIVVNCSPDHQPTMNDVRLAIEHSDYTVSLHARLEMLTRTRAYCASRPTAALTWLPPDEMGNARDTKVARQ
jgi:hypothetical protein